MVSSFFKRKPQDTGPRIGKARSETDRFLGIIVQDNGKAEWQMLSLTLWLVVASYQSGHQVPPFRKYGKQNI